MNIPVLYTFGNEVSQFVGNHFVDSIYPSFHHLHHHTDSALDLKITHLSELPPTLNLQNVFWLLREGLQKLF